MAILSRYTSRSTLNATSARQGRFGVHMFWVLVVSTALAALALFGAWSWRADDLACLIAHLSTIQRMNPAQEAKVHRLIRTWVPVFDTRVDPLELRLRAAAVIISLATGPFRGQEPEWEWETLRMIASAEALVRQVG